MDVYTWLLDVPSTTTKTGSSIPTPRFVVYLETDSFRSPKSWSFELFVPRGSESSGKAGQSNCYFLFLDCKYCFTKNGRQCLTWGNRVWDQDLMFCWLTWTAVFISCLHGRLFLPRVGWKLCGTLLKVKIMLNWQVSLNPATDGALSQGQVSQAWAESVLIHSLNHSIFMS